MLKRFTQLLMMSTLLAALGCGNSDNRPILDEIPAPTPLTVEEWKQLPIVEKYDELSLERLKLNDPKLKNPSAWNAFVKSQILPERKKDFPSTP